MMIALWILGMLASFLMTLFIYRRAELGRLIIVSQGFYYFIFVIVSGGMLWINHFNLMRGVWCTLLAELIAIGIFCMIRSSYFRRSRIGQRLKLCRKEPLRITPAWEKYFPLAILLIVCAFLVHDKAGIHGAGQDQGLYQIRAMMYMGGYNDNIIDFPEYYYVENNWEKSEYLRELDDMAGYYLLKKDGLENANDVNGVLHGISTFPALLGLWGKMFGLHNMPGILTVFYLLAVANVWLIGDNLKFKPWVNMILAAFTAVSPIVVWSAKQTLTEIGLTLMMCAFFELLTENIKNRTAFWSALPLVAACYYHVIFTVLLPLFILLYLTNYLQSKNRGFLAALMVLMTGYATGFSMMWKSARHYSIANLSQLFNKFHNLINEDNIEGVIWIASSVVVALALILCQKEVRRKLFSWWDVMRQSDRASRLITWTLRGITLLLLIFFVYKGIKAHRMDMWPMKLSIVGYLIMTGYIMLPFMILGIWRKAESGLKNRNIVTMTLSAFYVLFVYCGILWVLIYFYYYYARYLAPFVPLVLVAAGYFINRFKWQIMVPVCVLMAGVMIWQSWMLYTDKDLTYCSYEQMETIASLIGNDSYDTEAIEEGRMQKDVILIYDQGYHSPRIFALALKGLTGADILYLNYDRLATQIMECRVRYDEIYVVQYDLDRFNEDSGEWIFLYQGDMEVSLYDSYVEETGLPYAKQVIAFKTPLALLKYNR